MIRFGVLFTLIAFMAFLALYDNGAHLSKLYKDIVSPMGWKKIDIVDERRAFKDFEIPWTTVEQLLLGTAAIVIGVTVGWRAHDYCREYGTNFEPDLLEKFIEKQKHIEERLNALEVKVNRFEIKCSMDTELIYSRDHKDREPPSTKDAFQQIIIENTDRSSQTSQRGSYPPSVAEADEEAEDPMCDSPVWATASGTTVTIHDNAEAVEARAVVAEEEAMERTLYEVEVFPVEIDLGPCEDYSEITSEPERTTTPDSPQVKVIGVADALACAAVGAGECEGKTSPQERRIPQLQGLRKSAEKTRLYREPEREERPMSATKVLEPTEVTKLPQRANTARRYVPEGVETSTANRRRKQRHPQVK